MILKRYTFLTHGKISNIYRQNTHPPFTYRLQNTSLRFDLGTKNDNIPNIVHINWNLKNTNFWGPGITIVSTAPITAPPNSVIRAICRSEN